MQLWILQQNEYYDFTTPDKVNTMIVRAESAELARGLAQKSEDENRDGDQKWDADNASISSLSMGGRSMVILTA